MIEFESLVNKSALKRAGEKSSLSLDAPINDRIVEGVQCSNLSLSQAEFDEATFKSGLFQNCDFISSIMTGCSFCDAEFSEVEFFLPFMSQINFENCTIADTQIIGGEFYDVIFKNCKFKNVTFAQSAMGLVTFFKNVSLEGCKLEGVRIEYDESESGEILKHAGIKLIQV